MMPYNDRLGRFSEWYVQLWAESLGKGGEGTTPVPALGPLDQHSQLQLFMDGPREIAVTVVARCERRRRRRCSDADMAKIAGSGLPGRQDRSETLLTRRRTPLRKRSTQAGRPVRTFDLATLDERTMGALLMHFMIETILAGRLLGLDPFDQPAVELAKTLTRERLARWCAPLLLRKRDCAFQLRRFSIEKRIRSDVRGRSSFSLMRPHELATVL